jgi:hypothetical protein
LFFVVLPIKKLSKRTLLKSNSTSKTKVALIEIGGSHDECIYSQIAGLKSAGCEVILALNPILAQRNPQFAEMADQLLEIPIKESSKSERATVRQMISDLKARNVEIIVFNTGQGKLVRNAVFKLFFSKIKCIGIMHTTTKFEGSFKQWMISLKIRKYAVLSQFLMQKAKPAKKLSLDYFYPLRFPTTVEQRVSDKVEITIIGGVENRRKDLDGFIRMTEGLKNQNVRFTFLGKSDEKLPEVVDFNQKIQKSSIAENVEQFNHFVDQEAFSAQLGRTDAILLLVHPNTRSAEEYFNHRISGAMNVAFGHKIPLLIHDGYQHVDELTSAAIYYNEKNFLSVLEEVKKTSITVRAKMNEHQAYNREYQEKRYADFVLTK